MQWIIFKYAITAGIVVLISEIAKRSDKIGGLIAALPLVTVLTLIWLFIENQSSEKIANHAWYTFWYVVPTLPMFLAFPWLLKRMSFWPTMGISIIITLLSFYVFAKIVKVWGIELMWASIPLTVPFWKIGIIDFFDRSHSEFKPSTRPSLKFWTKKKVTFSGNLFEI